MVFAWGSVLHGVVFCMGREALWYFRQVIIKKLFFFNQKHWPSHRVSWKFSSLKKNSWIWHIAAADITTVAFYVHSLSRMGTTKINTHRCLAWGPLKHPLLQPTHIITMIKKSSIKNDISTIDLAWGPLKHPLQPTHTIAMIKKSSIKNDISTID